MEASARSRSTRDRPAKPPLSEDSIVDAALAVTKADGLGAVTMRRIATELDTGAASLYVYFRNRDELLRAMLDRIGDKIPLVEPDPKRWREQMRDFLDAYRESLEEYPGLATVLPGAPTLTESVLDKIENMLAILDAGGVTAQDAAWACDILTLIVTATAAEADLRRDAGQEIDDNFVEDMRSAFAEAPPERYPTVVRHASELVAGDARERFFFAIDALLDGLVARSQDARR